MRSFAGNTGTKGIRPILRQIKLLNYHVELNKVLRRAAVRMVMMGSVFVCLCAATLPVMHANCALSDDRPRLRHVTVVTSSSILRNSENLGNAATMRVF